MRILFAEKYKPYTLSIKYTPTGYIINPAKISPFHRFLTKWGYLY